MMKIRGFTLVELLVVLSLGAMIGTIGLRLFSSVNTTQTKFSQQILLQMEARKAFDQLSGKIRESIEVVRPTVGETLSFLVVKDIVNRTILFYLEPNIKKSNLLNEKVYNLVAYTSDYETNYKPENKKVLLDSVKNIRFSSLSPLSIQANVTVVNEKTKAQFISRLGLLTTGDLD